MSDNNKERNKRLMSFEKESRWVGFYDVLIRAPIGPQPEFCIVMAAGIQQNAARWRQQS